METFSSWIQNLRKSAGIDLRTLGLVSGVHFTTIGRVENGQNEPTLESAIKITTALNGSYFGLFRWITQKDAIAPLQNNEKNRLMPTLEDVIFFEKLILEKPKTCGEYCAYLLNRVFDLNPDIEKLKVNEVLKNNSISEQEWLVETLSQPVFTASDIHKFILSPQNEKSRIFLHPEFIYPEKFDNEMVLEVYKGNGVLIIEDVKRYISDFAHDYLCDPNSFEKENIQNLKKIEQISSKIAGLNEISGLKLSDILLLDQELAYQGEIFIMAWRAVMEEIRVNSLSNKSNAGRFLVFISRFLAVHNNPEPDWLRNLHILS